MKHPLLIAALSYAAGLLAVVGAQSLWVALILVVPVILLSVGLRSLRRVWFVYPLLFLAGVGNLAIRTAIGPDDLRALVPEEVIIASVRGRLVETPSLRIFQRDVSEFQRTIAEMKVSALARGSNWQPAAGRIVVTTPGNLPANFFQGRDVEIAGVLAVPPQPVANGLFDYRTFLARQGIYFQFRAGTNSDWQAREPSRKVRPLSDRFLEWAQHTLARGVSDQDESIQLIWAMTLGWKTALTGEVSEPFTQSGTMHIFAISGLHIALISGILVRLLRGCHVRRSWCGSVVIPLIWFYTMATGWQPSAIRSTVMMTIVIGGWALRRPSDLLNSLAAAALVILLFDPLQLFQASFQLSFFVVLSMALLLPHFEKIRDRIFKTDPMLPQELIPRWKRAVRFVLRWLATAFATSLAAWVGALPLTAYYFNIFSPVTLLANVVIVPLSGLALAANMGSVICGDWLPGLTVLFNHTGWFFMEGMVKVSRWATEFPGAFYYVPAPAIVTVVIYYVLLVGGANGWLFARKFRAGTITTLVVIAAIYGWRWQVSRSEIQLTVLPLNGGHAVFVDAAGWKNDWLMDCGNTNAFEFVLKPYLRAQGVNHVPRLLLTHGDLQHVGSAPLVEEVFGVGEIYTSSVRFRSPAYRRVITGLEETPERHRVVNRGDAVGVWRVLHPRAADKFPQGDDNALVLLGTFYNTRVLLLSDLGRPGQEALLSRTNDLRADIVITGLSEQTEPLCDALIEAIQPKLIIIADSEFPATKRASEELAQRIESHKVPVVYTRKVGAVTITTRLNEWMYKTGDNRPSQRR